MDRRVTPPKRVTSPTLGPPPPCKQADHTSYSVYHACKECYHDSNTLRVEGFFFFITEQKISVFNIIRIRVADSYLLSEIYI